MAVADTAKMIASLSLKDGLTPVVKTMSGSLDKLDTRIGKSGSRAFKTGQQIGTGIKAGAVIAVGAITGLAALSIELAKEGQDAANVQLKYATAIKNSGKVSADYVKVLNAQQDAILNLTGADDELVKAQQTTLITMGLTGQQIATVVPLIFDAAKATGKDVGAVTLAVGKAVQGNVAGLGRLGIVLPKAAKATKSAALTTLEYQKATLLNNEAQAKAHASLTKDQQAQFTHRKAVIDAAISQQKLTDSQTKGSKAASSYDTVVGALTKRFKGVDEATSGSLDVRLKVFNERLANIREEAGQNLLPAMTKIVDIVGAKLVPAFGQFIDTILPVVLTGLDKLGGFLEGGGATAGISKFLDIAKTAAPIIKTAAEDTLTIVQTAAGLFTSLPPEIQALAVAGLTINKLTGGLVTNVAGGLISAVVSSFKGLMNVNAAVVNVNGAIGGAGLPSVLPAAGAGAAGVGVGLLGASAAITGAVAATVIGSASVRNAVDQAITNSDVTNLTAQADAARKHGVSDSNNAALKALQAIAHNTESLATPTTANQSAQDASEKAQQKRNIDFTSNPTRKELRTQIGQLKVAQKNATAKNATDISRKVASLQNRLDNRIAAASAKAVQDAGSIVRAIKAAAPVVTPVINVPVTTQTVINGRLVTTNFSRYTSVIGGKVVNATSMGGA